MSSDQSLYVVIKADGPRTRWLKMQETWIACYGFFHREHKGTSLKKVLSSLSSTSLDSLTSSSSSSWSLSSSSEDISLPDTAVSPLPSAPEEDGWDSLPFPRPLAAGLKRPRREPASRHPVQFNIRRKLLEELWGGLTPHLESLTDLILEEPNLQQASRGTSEADTSTSSGGEALSEEERRPPQRAQEDVQQSSSSEMMSAVSRPSSCPTCNLPTSWEPSAHPLTPPETSSIQGRLLPSLKTSRTHVKIRALLLEDMMMSKGMTSPEEQPVLHKLPFKRALHPCRRPCTAIGPDTAQRLDFNVKRKQIPELWGEPTPLTQSLAKMECQAPYSPSPVPTPSPPERAEKEGRRQPEPTSAHQSSVKTKAKLLEMTMLTGESVPKEQPALPKPLPPMAHHPYRGPHKAVGPDTAECLDFNGKRKQPEPTSAHQSSVKTKAKLLEMTMLTGESVPKEQPTLPKPLPPMAPWRESQDASRHIEEEPSLAIPLMTSEEEGRMSEHTKAPSPGSALPTAGEEVPRATPPISGKKESTVLTTPMGSAGVRREFRPGQKTPASPQPARQIASSQAVLQMPGDHSRDIVAKLPPSFQGPPEPPSRQQLIRSILTSLSVEQTVEDLRLSLVQGLEMGHGELRAQYPMCRLCGSCSARCPHPRTHQDPLLHVDPRLTVRDGHVHMDLDFHLKFKRTYGKKWGLAETVEGDKVQEQPPERCVSIVKPSVPTDPPSFQGPPEPPSRQQLIRSILTSLSVEQTVEDLPLSLVQALEMGHGELRAQYPMCRLCGSCSARCPHPRTQQDPLLHVYPRLTVRDGHVHMGLDFHLKIKRTHAKKWGLAETVEGDKVQEQPPERCVSIVKPSVPTDLASRAPHESSRLMVHHRHVGTKIQATASSVQLSVVENRGLRQPWLPPTDVPACPRVQLQQPLQSLPNKPSPNNDLYSKYHLEPPLIDDPPSIPLRQSRDRGMNYVGLCLMLMSAKLNLSFLNGRIRGDLEGELTYLGPRGVSVIDMIFVSLELFAQIKCCRVLARPESDHFPITSIVHGTNKSPFLEQRTFAVTDVEVCPARIKWIPKLQEKIAEGLNSFELQTIKNQIITATYSSVNYHHLYHLINKIQDLIRRDPREIMRRPTHKVNLWFDSECYEARTQVRSLHQAFNLHRSHEHLGKFRAARKMFKQLIKRKKIIALRQTWQNLLQASKLKDSTMFWHIIAQQWPKSNFQLECAIAPAIWENYYTPLYQGNYIMDDPLADPSIEFPVWSPVTSAEVLDLIATLKSNKAPGPDNIPPEVFKANAKWWAPTLAALFTNINSSMVIPQGWGAAIIIPIYKKGSRLNPANYRPISLLNIISKLYTTYLYRKLLDWVNQTDLLAPEQAGFRVGRSSSDHVLVLQHLITKYSKTNGHALYTAFVDLRAAFDSISRSRLWLKMQNLGIDRHLLTLIQGLYHNTSLQIRCNNQGHLTKRISTFKGVKQGCILATLLFNIYINPLVAKLTSIHTHYC
ncbi:uncharacterized protein LOC133373121 [Rhineura floridana]|uniref:uncharacterized protein LOC133373121 n=1 Tax=Rhineura floridana TaxID=261503 RepID=UPI002AC83990|nr:uncharacterized protein LOC133373121 [Rhineura floridana]